MYIYIRGIFATRRLFYTTCLTLLVYYGLISFMCCSSCQGLSTIAKLFHHF